MQFKTLPETINGVTIAADCFDFMVKSAETEGGLLYFPQSWSNVRYHPKDNPTGLTKAAQPMYFVHRFFLETMKNAWNRFVYVVAVKDFYEIVDGLWIRKEMGDVKSIISPIITLYFRETTPKLERDCISQLETFYARSKLEQNREVVPFQDCCLSRSDLIAHKITVLPINPADQIIEHIPHKVKEAFENLQITPDQFTPRGICDLLFQHPFGNMLDEFIPRELQEMIFGMIGDLIDVDIPHQWLFLFQSRHGGTGKGTIATLLQNIVGIDYWVRTNKNLLKGHFGESFLMHKKLYVIPETSKDSFRGDVLPLIKSYSGGDGATANIKNVKNSFNFTPRGIFFISTNDAPHFPPKEMAIFRRIILIPMLRPTPIPIKEYKEFLRQIYSHLDELLALCTLLIPFKEEMHGHYKSTHDVEDTYDEIIEEPEWDFFDQFIEQGTADNKIVITELYQHFQDFLTYIGRINYMSGIKGFAKMFNKHLRNNGLVFKKNRVRIADNHRVYTYKMLKYNDEEIKTMEAQLIAIHAGKV